MAIEVTSMLRDLGEYDVPVLLLAGGEPLARPDLCELAAFVAVVVASSASRGPHQPRRRD